MRLHLILAFVVLTPALLPAGDSPPEAAKKDLDQLQGTWVVTSLETDGKPASAEEVKGSSFTVKDAQYTLKGKESYRGTLTLDPARKPKAIDATFVDDQGKEKGKAVGIYELEGGRLKICWSDKGGERPSAFVSRAGSGTRLMVFEKGK
jgi:uncharacterized protein (TIGR03067 family)